MNWTCQHRLHIKSKFDKNDLTPLIKELQTMYYLKRLKEISQQINSVESDLAMYDANDLTKTLIELSMSLFKSS